MRSFVVALITTGSLICMPLTVWAAPPTPVPTTAPATESVPAPALDPSDGAADDGTAAAEARQAQQRRDQLALHQGLAIAALIGMVCTGIVGQVLHYQRDVALEVPVALTATHIVLASTTTLLYGSAATLALTAPPPTQPALGAGGFDPIVLHRGISWLHAATLGATVTLGLMSVLNVRGLAGVHQALAWTTTGLMAFSGGLIVFNF
ncbi:MAG: hypothetical protein H7338_23955 [Candidatus Sericytochromatia bacterium]|nr:hypothetical protein [Candidatus Sericytochromatia bacterium]